MPKPLELALPMSRISLEMVYRGLYHFSVAYDKGKAIAPVKYFADPKNQDLGVVKSQSQAQQKIDLSPSPGSQLPPAQFHHPNLKTQTAHHLNLSRMPLSNAEGLREHRARGLTRGGAIRTAPQSAIF